MSFDSNINYKEKYLKYKKKYLDLKMRGGTYANFLNFDDFNTQLLAKLNTNKPINIYNIVPRAKPPQKLICSINKKNKDSITSINNKTVNFSNIQTPYTNIVDLLKLTGFTDDIGGQNPKNTNYRKFTFQE
jgi:hypothetical protein